MATDNTGVHVLKALTKDDAIAIRDARTTIQKHWPRSDGSCPICQTPTVCTKLTEAREVIRRVDWCED